jgi:hypothetical protein
LKRGLADLDYDYEKVLAGLRVVSELTTELPEE